MKKDGELEQPREQQRREQETPDMTLSIPGLADKLREHSAGATARGS